MEASDLLFCPLLLPPPRGRVYTASQVEPRRAHTQHAQRAEDSREDRREEGKAERTELLPGEPIRILFSLRELSVSVSLAVVYFFYNLHEVDFLIHFGVLFLLFGFV